MANNGTDNRVAEGLSIESGMKVAPMERDETRKVCESPFRLEPFVQADTVAAFFSIPRSDVLRMTREGKIRGYPYKGRLRHVYRYRLSEVSADFEAVASKTKRTMPEAPVSRRRKSNG